MKLDDTNIISDDDFLKDIFNQTKEEPKEDERELSEVENIADRLKMKRAAAAREILVSNSKRLKSQIKKNDNSEILFLYSKISNNINQIAKKMNTNLDKFLSGNGEEFALLIEEIFEDMEKLKNDT